MATKTTTPPPISESSPKPVLEAEIHKVNDVAKSTPPSPAKDEAHRRINQLLDWLVGR